MENLILTTPEQLRQLLREELAALQIAQPQPPIATEPQTQVLDLKTFCELYGYRPGTVYKLTSKGEVPFSRRGKRLFFDRTKIDHWLLENSNGYLSKQEINQQVSDYISAPKKRRGINRPATNSFSHK